MTGPFRESWNEFDWEAELKKDDARVNAYMKELPRYIDLPAEDDVIMKHIQEKPELVPFAGGKDYDLENLFNSEEENQEELSEEWQRRPGAEFYIGCSRLARLWAQSFILCGKSAGAIPSMRILCLYGKIMARSADIIDMEEGETPPLKIAILKRLLADVNLQMGELRSCSEILPQLENKCAFHTEQLMILREKILKMLGELRSGKSGKK